jgi:mitogen-activated protein kinase 15
MHASGALHRDLKPANVLLDLDGHLRLCDFGLCRSTPTPDEAALATPRAPLDASNAAEVDGSQSVSVGSRWYRAPEVLLGASVYGASADMWSFGCIVAEVLSGKTLLLGSSSLGQLAKILEVTGGRPEAAELAADLSLPEERARAALAALPITLAPTRLSKLLPRVPAEGIDLVNSLLRRRPTERASFDAVIRHSYLVPFITEDEGPRRAFAAASVGTADRFIAPLDDRRQFAPRTYREYFEQHLAETLEAYHEAPPPAAAPSEADMGC